MKKKIFKNKLLYWSLIGGTALTRVSIFLFNMPQEVWDIPLLVGISTFIVLITWIAFIMALTMYIFSIPVEKIYYGISYKEMAEYANYGNFNRGEAIFILKKLPARKYENWLEFFLLCNGKVEKTFLLKKVKEIAKKCKLEEEVVNHLEEIVERRKK